MAELKKCIIKCFEAGDELKEIAAWSDMALLTIYNFHKLYK